MFQKRVLFSVTHGKYMYPKKIPAFLLLLLFFLFVCLFLHWCKHEDGYLLVRGLDRPLVHPPTT